MIIFIDGIILAKYKKFMAVNDVKTCTTDVDCLIISEKIFDSIKEENSLDDCQKNTHVSVINADPRTVVSIR